MPRYSRFPDLARAGGIQIGFARVSRRVYPSSTDKIVSGVLAAIVGVTRQSTKSQAAASQAGDMHHERRNVNKAPKKSLTKHIAA